MPASIAIAIESTANGQPPTHIAVENPRKAVDAHITSQHVNTAQEIQSKEDEANSQLDHGPMATFFS